MAGNLSAFCCNKWKKWYKGGKKEISKFPDACAELFDGLYDRIVKGRPFSLWNFGMRHKIMLLSVAYSMMFSTYWGLEHLWENSASYYSEDTMYETSPYSTFSSPPMTFLNARNSHYKYGLLPEAPVIKPNPSYEPDVFVKYKVVHLTLDESQHYDGEYKHRHKRGTEDNDIGVDIDIVDTGDCTIIDTSYTSTSKFVCKKSQDPQAGMGEPPEIVSPPPMMYEEMKKMKSFDDGYSSVFNSAVWTHSFLQNGSPNEEDSSNFPYSGTPVYSKYSIIFMIILIFIIICTIAGNIFVIFAIFAEKSLQSLSNYLVVSLATADLMVACLVMPFGAIYEVTGVWDFGPQFCDLWTGIDVMCCSSSILHLVAIAVDRYWAVTDVEYVAKRSKKKVLMMIIIVWVSAAVISIPPMLGWRDAGHTQRIANRQCMISQDVGYQIFATFMTFYIPLCFILFLYLKIFEAARSRIYKRNLRTTNYGASTSTAAVVERAKVTPTNCIFGMMQRCYVVCICAMNCFKCRSRANSAVGGQGQVNIPMVEIVSAVPVIAAGSSQPTDSLGKRTKDGLTIAVFQPKLFKPESDTEDEYPCAYEEHHSFGTDYRITIEEDEEDYLFRCVLGSDANADAESVDSELYGPSDEEAAIPRAPVSQMEAVPMAVIADAKEGTTRSVLMNEGKRETSRAVKVMADFAARIRGMPLGNERRSGEGETAATTNIGVEPSSTGENAPNPFRRFLFLKRGNKSKPTLEMKREKKAFKTLAIITGVFVICWLPFFSVALLLPLCASCQIHPYISSLILWLGYLNSTLNPVIYTIFNPEFRKAFARILGAVKGCNHRNR